MNKKESHYRLAENISKIRIDGMHKVFFLDTPGILHYHETFHLSGHPAGTGIGIMIHGCPPACVDQT